MITRTFPLPVIVLCLLAAGGLQTLTLAPFNYWPLGILSIALVLFITKALTLNEPSTNSSTSAPREKNRGFLYGWLFGIGLFGSGSSWVYISIHTYGYASPPLATFLTVLFVAGLALFHGLLFWLYFRLRTSYALHNTLLFSGLWVLSDGFRTIFLTGFPWLFLGYGHLESPLSGWIPVIGVYGLTFITVLTGGLLTYLLTPSSISNQPKVIFASLVGVVWIAGTALQSTEWTSEIKDQEKSIALLQINIPQELKWHPSQRRKTIKLLDTQTRENWDKDIVIWPETAIPMLYDQAIPYLDRLSVAAEEHNTNIITGIPFRQFNQDGSQTMHNSITSFGKGEGIYHKQKLVPFGEYVPLQSVLRGLIAFFDLPMSDFRTGPEDQALLQSQNLKTAPFICYEVVYPDFVANNAQGADYLLTISNDSWFGASIGPLQHLEMAQMRAAENGRYMVRATNNGISAIIDEKGQITDQSKQFVREILHSTVKAFSGQTPFSSLGSIPVFLISLLFCIAPLFLSRTTKNSPQANAESA